MFRPLLFSFFILVGCVRIVHAQQNDFCSGLLKVLASASNRFSDVKDSSVMANEYGGMWSTKFNIPGAIKCRLVSAMGIRYEAALFQSKSLEAIQQSYHNYKSLLKDCLQNKSYKLSTADNFYPGLGDYKKIMYTKPAPADTTDNALPPPHVSMEVDYLKNNGTYTLILNVWEH